MSMHECPPHFWVADEEGVQMLLETLVATPEDLRTLYMDFEGINLCRYGKICIGQLVIKSVNEVYLLDFVEFPDLLEKEYSGTTLKEILEEEAWKKVFFDPRNDIDALYHLHGVLPRNVLCLQLADVAADRQQGGRRPHSYGLAKVLSNHLPYSIIQRTDRIKMAGKFIFAPEKGGSYEAFEERPLNPALVEYCVVDVQYFEFLEKKLVSNLTPTSSEWVIDHSQRRAKECLKDLSKADLNGRHRAIAPI